MRTPACPRSFVALAIIVVIVTSASEGLALIRLDFTPTHLVRTSELVAELEISCNAEGALKVRVIGAPKGKAPAAMPLAARDQAAEFLREVAAKPSPALAFMVKDRSEVGKADGAERPAGALHVANAWFSLYARDGGYDVRKDALDLKTVWAGSTEMLRRGVRYVLADPSAHFPVKVGVRWRDETAVGKIDGGVCGVQSVELAPGKPPALFLQSMGGDRLYQYRDDAFADITVARGLGSKSKRAAWTDLDADGRLDLVSWDGAAAAAWLQTPEGRFAAKGAAFPLTACTGLAAVCVGQPARGAVACGADGAVLLLTLGDAGLTVAQKLVVPEAMRAALGAPGPVMAADFDADGWTDLVQVYEQGLVVWPGTPTGGFGAARLALSATLGKDITAADVGDLDGDGLLDIVLAGKYGASEAAGVNILANRGGLTFAPAWNEAGEIYKIQTRARTCQVCDINADGRPDIMIA
ncbi:MAG: FG-GAP-like repeat-containing protein, partial [Thermoguttaceae bacterium]